MDWSFFKHPAKRPFLRQELIYSNSVVCVTHTSRDSLISHKTVLIGLLYRDCMCFYRRHSTRVTNILQISNIIGRFQWILYLPFVDVNFQVRQFIVGMLEMVRRWQWNFCKYFIYPLMHQISGKLT